MVFVAWLDGEMARVRKNDKVKANQRQRGGGSLGKRDGRKATQGIRIMGHQNNAMVLSAVFKKMCSPLLC